MNKPILTYNDGAAAISQIARYNPMLHFLGAAPRDFIKHLLTCPLSLAYWVAKHCPQVVDQPVIRIVIPGASINDGADHGLAYGLIPALMASKAVIELDLVGEELADNKTALFAGLQAARLPVRVRRHAGTISSWLQTLPKTERWDVCFLSAPGMELHGEQWLAENELPALLLRTAFTFGTAYTQYDRLIDHAAMITAGYPRPLAIEDSPFRTVADRVSGMMRFPSIYRASPKMDTGPFVSPFASTTKALMYPQADEMRFGLTQTVPGFPETFRSLLGDLVVDIENGAVFAVLDYNLHYGDVDMDQSDLRFPGDASNDIDLLLWSKRVLSRIEFTEEGAELWESLRIGHMQAKENYDNIMLRERVLPPLA